MLIYEKASEGEEGFEEALDLFPDSFNPKEIQPEFSGVGRVREGQKGGEESSAYCSLVKFPDIIHMRTMLGGQMNDANGLL